MPYSRAPSAKILANRKARVQMNRAALDEAVLGMADALLSVGEKIAADARDAAPRDPATAQRRGVPMMADTGTLGVWAAGKKTGGGMVSKPRVTKIVESKTIPGTFRSVRRVASTPRDQAVLFVGFTSRIAHFVELGTVKMIARPFLTPALNRNLPGLSATLVPAIGKRVKAAP